MFDVAILSKCMRVKLSTVDIRQHQYTVANKHFDVHLFNYQHQFAVKLDTVWTYWNDKDTVFNYRTTRKTAYFFSAEIPGKNNRYSWTT